MKDEGGGRGGEGQIDPLQKKLPSKGPELLGLKYLPFKLVYKHLSTFFI